MRNVPVDSARLALLATGKVIPKAEYVNLSDGTSKRSGNQATNPDGVPLWTVDCLVDDDDVNARSEIVGVTVPAHVMPSVAKFKPITFRDLVAVQFRDNMTGQPKHSLKASAIESAPAAVKSVSAS